MEESQTKKWSSYVIYFISIFWLIFYIKTQDWKKQHFRYDIIFYYGYLPAHFIHHDLSLEFTADKTIKDRDLYAPEYAKNGGKVIKTTMGLSYLYAPFFLTAREYAKKYGDADNALSTPYQVALVFSAFVWLMIGLYFLRKLLRLYFDETTTALTIFAIYFGSNLMWYTTGEPLMSHGYLFSITAVYFYLIVKWCENGTFLRTLAIGLVIGLMVLIRPTMILMLIPFGLYALQNNKGLKQFLIFLFERKFQIVLIFICCFLVGLPQLLYWKSITGQYLFFSYNQERFFFNNSHILDGIFSYRKGWLIYSPVMIISIAGIFLMKDRVKDFQLGVAATIALAIYVIFSWWTWWFGGGFGARPMVDFYAMLALPFAASIQFIRENKKRVIILSPIIVFLVYIGTFQNYQYNEGLIHHDSNSKKSYWGNFLKRNWSPTWWDDLEVPDYLASLRSIDDLLPMEYSNHLFEWNKYQNPAEPVKSDFKLSVDSNYAPVLSIPITDLQSLNADSLHITVFLANHEKLKKGELLGVFEYHDTSKVVGTHSFDMSNGVIAGANQWSKLHARERINPEEYPGTKFIRLYIVSSANRDLFFENYEAYYTSK